MKFDQVLLVKIIALLHSQICSTRRLPSMDFPKVPTRMTGLRVGNYPAHLLFIAKALKRCKGQLYLRSTGIRTACRFWQVIAGDQTPSKRIMAIAYLRRRTLVFGIYYRNIPGIIKSCLQKESIFNFFSDVTAYRGCVEITHGPHLWL